MLEVPESSNVNRFARTFLDLFLGTLHRQVVTIHHRSLTATAEQQPKNDHSKVSIDSLMIIGAHLALLFRLVTLTVCTYLAVPDYTAFLDLTMSNVFFRYEREILFLNGFVILLICHSLVNYLLLFCFKNPDPFVWGHLYDLVVNNKNEMMLKPKTNQARWFHFLNRVCPFHFETVLKSTKRGSLQHYSNLKPQVRLRCQLITFTFEVLTFAALLTYFLSMFSVFYCLLAKLQAVKTIAMLFFQIALIYATVLVNYSLIVFTLLEALLITLLCTVYTELHRQMIRKLAVKVDFITLTRLITGHFRLTTFISRFNQKIVSKVITLYLFGKLPVGIFWALQLYYTEADERYISQYMFQALHVFLFGMVILIVARFNEKICQSSGRKILKPGSFAKRKRILVVLKHLKFLTTYEIAIWRTEQKRQIGFTASGQIINRMFLLKVGVTKIDMITAQKVHYF